MANSKQTSTTRLKLDTEYLYSTLANHYCITDATKKATNGRVTEAIKAVEAQLDAKDYGFVEVLKDATYLDQTMTVLAEIGWAETLVVVGIGGSDLGARAVQVALEEHPKIEVLFHGDSTDPTQIARLLKKIDLAKTVFNIVSKSGQTVETISQYVYFKDLIKQQTQEWQKHFVFTTDDIKGVLRVEADTHGVTTLSIPESVGGRFSVLTPVGLFPAAAMGVDIEQLVQGALDFAQDPARRGMAQEFAQTQYQLSTQDTKVSVIMPYAVQLEEFARWFRQLWGESLGKDDKGILPVQARGPADQHSQIQFYNQGVPMESILFLSIEQFEQDYRINSVDLSEVSYLEGKSFSQIVHTEQSATAESLRDLGRPSALLSIKKLNAYALGELFMFFELAVVYLAEMLEVNAFDQPGVEAGKKIIYAQLGRKE